MRCTVVLGVAFHVIFSAGCGGDDSGDDGPRPMTFGGDRPVDLKVPPSFDATRRYPLILALHGYSSNGFVHGSYFGLPNLVASGEALLLAPDGTTDSGGKQFWNADPACCDFNNKNPDDVGYLGKLIDDVSASWPVDPARVFVIGHSNGSFMAYRMACERADVITAIAGLAGAASSVAASCTPSRSVNVLHIHGTADAVVPYDGGGLGGGGAVASVQQWVGHGNCGGSLVTQGTLDLESSIPGAETTRLAAACPDGVGIELWRVDGASHVPNWGPSFTPELWTWLTDHARR
ncbi:MAG: hypothetical protein H0T89_15060 [Deltaproteobacteria bacterium]|nr:hypothetical protein [Deltaproteobacteria bacterium]MDQ3295121.1 hypothetical protein [Myxococcota bacterium]